MARIGIKYQMMHRNSEDFQKMQNEMPAIILKAKIPNRTLKAQNISIYSHYRKLKEKTYTIENMIGYMQLICAIKTAEKIENYMPEFIQTANIQTKILIEKVGIRRKTFNQKLKAKNFSNEEIIQIMAAVISIKETEIQKLKQQFK